MRVRWTRLARTDLEEIRKYIAAANPKAAHRVGTRLREAAAKLSKHPYLGRPGSVPGTREKPALPYPYVIVYEVNEQAREVWILRVYHMARNRP
jgi:addiction module RelE/StbE family toxin